MNFIAHASIAEIIGYVFLALLGLAYLLAQWGRRRYEKGEKRLQHTQPIEQSKVPDGLYVNGERHVRAPADNDYDDLKRSQWKRGVQASTILFDLGWKFDSRSNTWTSPSGTGSKGPVPAEVTPGTSVLT